jgi:GMP synthase-like glutamine amidotransferase
MSRNPLVVLVDCGSAKVSALATMLESCSLRCAVIALDEAEGRAMVGCDGAVISGGPRLFTAEPALIECFAFIDDLTVPTLGICLGHQAIALRHGAEVHLGPARRTPEPITLLTRHPLVEGLAQDTVFGQDHCEDVSLPPGFQRLGSSAHCEVEIMVAHERPLHGVQFHPEISGDPGRRLIDNFVGIVRAASRSD